MFRHFTTLCMKGLNDKGKLAQNSKDWRKKIWRTVYKYIDDLANLLILSENREKKQSKKSMAYQMTPNDADARRSNLSLYPVIKVKHFQAYSKKKLMGH